MPRRRLLPALLALLAGLAACGAGTSGGVATHAGTTATTRTTASTSAPPAKSAGVTLGLQRIGSFSSPVYVTAPPGDSRRLFVVEQEGVIRVVRDGRKLPTPFLDIRDRVQCCGEQGLLSMAFAPDYARTGRFYVYYTPTEAPRSEWRRFAARVRTGPAARAAGSS